MVQKVSHYKISQFNHDKACQWDYIFRQTEVVLIILCVT